MHISNCVHADAPYYLPKCHYIYVHLICVYIGKGGWNRQGGQHGIPKYPT